MLHINYVTPCLLLRDRRMGGGTGGTGGGGPPQTPRRLALCLWALHGKNRLQMALAPPPQSSRHTAALGQANRGFNGTVHGGNPKKEPHSYQFNMGFKLRSN